MDSFHPIFMAIFVTIFVGGLAFAFLEPFLFGGLAIEERKDAIVGGGAQRKGKDDASARRRQLEQNLKEADERRTSKKITLEQKLEQAGFHISKKTYYVYSAIAALILAGIVTVVIENMGIGVCVLFVGFFGLPRFYVARAAHKRRQAFLEEFPNSLDAIVRGIRSGLPLNDCFRLIANEAREPVRSEFRKAVEAQSFGLTMDQAIARMYDDIPIQEVNLFSIVLQIQSKAGGNMTEVISNVSKVIRDRKKLRDRVSALSAEAKASTVIIAILPFFVGGLSYLTSPDLISLLWTTKAGMIGLAASGGMMIVGFLVIRAMSNFEV